MQNIFVPFRLQLLLTALVGAAALSTARGQAPIPDAAPPRVRVFVRVNNGATTAATQYEHTCKKSLSIEVVNLTPNPMDLRVKTTFLGREEAGAHDVRAVKSTETKLTVVPGRTEEFDTAEVGFEHTSPHRSPAKAKVGGRPAAAPMTPASGLDYFGYKVEAFQGNDLVGSAESENH